MNKITGVVLTFLISLAICQTPVFSALAVGSELLIVTIQTGGKTSATQEKIAIANVSNKQINLDGISLQYFSAKPKNMDTPFRTIKLKGTLAARNTFLLATKNLNITSDQIFEATLAADGGHLKLVGTRQYDLVGWGAAVNSNGQPALAPAAGEEIVRRQQNSFFQDTGNNSADFIINNYDIDEQENSPASVNNVDSETKVNQTNLWRQLKITEVYPDPVKPQTDAKDEFIEIFNPTNKLIDLSQIYLVVSAKSSKRKLLSGKLLPNQFLAFFTENTQLTLNNDGAKVALQNKTGDTYDQVSYPKAEAGASWAKLDNKWQWTGKPTPGSANIVASVQSKSKVGSSKRKSRRLSSSSLKGQVLSDQTDKSAAKKPELTKVLHKSAVAGVGGLAVLYGLYEYRQDMARVYQKFRRNRKTG